METLEVINRRLEETYGKFEDGRPHWRVVWADDQFEKRWITHTKDGLELLNPEVKEVPKYRQYIQGKHILERLIPIPPFVETDLIEKTSYECVWIFQDKDENPLPPKWEVILIIIDNVYKNAAKAVGAKYKDPLIGRTPEETLELKRERIKILEKELFGNETEVADALRYKEGVVVPTNYGENQ